MCPLPLALSRAWLPLLPRWVLMYTGMIPCPWSSPGCPVPALSLAWCINCFKPLIPSVAHPKASKSTSLAHWGTQHRPSPPDASHWGDPLTCWQPRLPLTFLPQGHVVVGLWPAGALQPPAHAAAGGYSSPGAGLGTSLCGISRFLSEFLMVSVLSPGSCGRVPLAIQQLGLMLG